MTVSSAAAAEADGQRVDPRDARVIGAELGPVSLVVDVRGRWGDTLTSHLRDFVSHPCPSPSLVLEETDSIGRRPGRRLIGPSREVALSFSDGPPRSVLASTRLTPRGLLRRLKRPSKPAVWERSRWLLFLRGAVEMPILAVLESDHGYVPVHASTVTGPKGAVLILGVNGSGKSTLAHLAVSQLGLHLSADNFSPCDGRQVVGFPGAPKPKPGAEPLPIRPRAGVVRLRGMVTVGFDVGGSLQTRSAGLRQYLSDDRESHRGTCWDEVFTAAVTRRPEVDGAVVALLARLPTLAYDWRKDGQQTVLDFMGECCGL